MEIATAAIIAIVLVLIAVFIGIYVAPKKFGPLGDWLLEKNFLSIKNLGIATGASVGLGAMIYGAVFVSKYFKKEEPYRVRPY